MKTEVTWKEGMHFIASARGINSSMDATEAVGGKNLGPTPKEMILQAICGCSGIDIVSILNKMRLTPSLFTMEAEGEQNDTNPKHFIKIQLLFRFEGSVPKEKILHAVELSMTKYCGVSYMIAKCCPIDYRVTLNGEEIASARAKFD